jgi:cytidyltransferase-like protein
MLTVVYPGTFDPFTRGHEDLARRASRLFANVVFAQPTPRQAVPFDAERVEMAQGSAAPLPNGPGFTLDAAHGLVHAGRSPSWIARGLTEYEFQMAGQPASVSDVETLFTPNRAVRSFPDTSGDRGWRRRLVRPARREGAAHGACPRSTAGWPDGRR